MAPVHAIAEQGLLEHWLHRQQQKQWAGGTQKKEVQHARNGQQWRALKLKLLLPHRRTLNAEAEAAARRTLKAEAEAVAAAQAHAER